MLYNIKRKIEIKITPKELAQGVNHLFSSCDFEEFCKGLSPGVWGFNSIGFEYFVQHDIQNNNSQNVDKLMLIFNTLNNIKQNIEDNKNNTSKEF